MKGLILILIIIFILSTLNVYAFESIFETKIDSGVVDDSKSAFPRYPDSDNDVAIKNCKMDTNSNDNIFKLLSNGDTTFQTAVNYGVGDYPNSVFSCDLDGNNDNDLAVANAESDNVSILLNNGDGTFQVAVNYGAGQRPHSIYSCDLDGDSDNDLAVADYGSYPTPNGTVSILLNNGDGTFQAAVSYAADWPYYIFASDLDGDNDNDLAVGSSHSYSISILINNGDGTFQTPVKYQTVSIIASIYSNDLDGDNDNDLVLTHNTADKISIMLNNGNGTFQAPVNYESGGEYPMAVFSIDLDGDDDNDLAVANYDSNSIAIFINNGNGSFQTAVSCDVGVNLGILCSSDLDNDNDNDIAVTNVHSRTVSILFNNGNGSFQTPVTFGVGSGPWGIFSCDFNGDDYNDLVVTNRYSDNVSILLNRLGNPVDVEDWQNNNLLPDKYYLGQNVPNPFNPSTTIEYNLPIRSHVTISVYNLLGQEIYTIINNIKPMGTHTAVWNGRDDNGNQVATGIYFYQIKTDDFVKSKKMLLLR